MTTRIFNDTSFPPMLIEDYIPTDLDSLPEELIQQIFSHLNALDLCRVSGVCKLWNKISKDDSLWADKFDSKRLLRPKVGSLRSICERDFLMKKKSIDMSIRCGSNLFFSHLIDLEDRLHPVLILHLIKYAAKYQKFFVGAEVINALLSYEDPNYRYLLTRSTEEHSEKLAIHIAEYKIPDQQLLVDLAMMCAERIKYTFMLWIKNFGIEREEDLVKVIKVALKKDPSGIGMSYSKLGIQSKKASQEMALIAAESSDSCRADLWIDWFGIEDLETIEKIEEICRGKAAQKIESSSTGSPG